MNCLVPSRKFRKALARFLYTMGGGTLRFLSLIVNLIPATCFTLARFLSWFSGKSFHSDDRSSVNLGVANLDFFEMLFVSAY